MIISTIFGEQDARIIAHYESEGVRHHLYVAAPDCGGATVLLSHEFTLVAEDVRFTRVANDSSSGELFVDPAVLTDELLDRMVDHEDGAVREYFRRVAERRG